MSVFWHAKAWQTLWRAEQENRLAHALLFSGLPGLGKKLFAEQFVQALLCESPKAIAPYGCQTCHSCRLVSGFTHPNVLRIEPEKAGQAIKVDQIRVANEFINQTSLQGNYRLVLIDPADNMNASAANALLKTLEEPPRGAIVILISSQVGYLPATILSRCQRTHFNAPPPIDAVKWLQEKLPDRAHDPHLLLRLAQGAPFAALNLASQEKLSERTALLHSYHALLTQGADPVRAAAKLPEMDLTGFLDYSLGFIIDLLKAQLMKSGGSILYNHDFSAEIKAINKRLHCRKAMSLLQYLNKIRRQLGSGINLNKQLLIEETFIRWTECV